MVSAFAATEMKIAVAAAAGDLVAVVGIALWLAAGLGSHLAVGVHEVAMNDACCGQSYRMIMYFVREFYTVGVGDCDRIYSWKSGDEVNL